MKQKGPIQFLTCEAKQGLKIIQKTIQSLAPAGAHNIQVKSPKEID